MNYIEQINMFWLLDTEHLFNGNETRLYFYLLKLSNSLFWKNPVTNADDYTAKMVGIAVNTMKTARNRLQQAGLIQFKPGGHGTRDKCVYFILPAENILNKVSNSDTFSAETLTPFPEPFQQKPDDISKPKPKKRKPKKEVVPAPPPPPEKNVEVKEPEPYWDLLVKTWFDFNVEKFKDQPSFADADPRFLKKIVGRLKKRAADKKDNWNEITAPKRLRGYLEGAFLDDWLSQHFLLENLLKQFDKVVLKQKEASNAKKKQAPALDLQYLYDRFLDGHLEKKLIQPEHFDMIGEDFQLTADHRLMAKKARIQNLSRSNEASFHRLAQDYIAGKQTPEILQDAETLTRMAKRLAVLDYFEQLKAMNLKSISDDQKKDIPVAV